MTQEASSERKSSSPMVSHLHKMIEANKQDRKSLAVLRRALSNEGIDFSAYTIVGRFIPKGSSLHAHEPYLLTACLFAGHQVPTDDGRSVGSSARILRVRLKVGQESLDRRFATVLNARAEDVAVHLRHLFSLLKSQNVAVDYAALLEDLRRWHYQNKQAQTRWAHDYWVGQGDDGEEEDKTSSSDVPGNAAEPDTEES